MKLSTGSLVLVLAAGCAAQTPATTDPSPTPDVPVGGVETTTDGDVAPAFATDRPCGNATVASVAVGASTVQFCVRDGVELLGEAYPLGTISELHARDLSLAESCGAEIFHALAPDRAVPPSLTEACALRPPVVSTRSRPHPTTTPEETEVASTYCGSAGEQNFIDNQCGEESCVGAPCSKWCTAELWGWHQRTATAQLGGGGNYADETVASCGGNTRFRAWMGDSLETLSLDTTVPAGTTYHWAMWSIGWFADTDFRFRGDSASDAHHRHTGTFQNF